MSFRYYKSSNLILPIYVGLNTKGLYVFFVLASSTRIKTIDPSSWTRTFLFDHQTNISISLFYPISNINYSLFSPSRSLLEYSKVWSIRAQYSYNYVKKEIKVLKF